MRLAEPNHKNLAILFAALCGIVLIAIALEVWYPPELGEDTGNASLNVDPAATDPRRRKAEAIALLPLSSYEEIVARPLFRPDRRPPDPAEAISEAQQAAAQAQQAQVHIEELFSLNGVVVTKGKTVALLQDIKNNKSVRVSEGEKLEGWRVERVLPESVLFSNNGRSESLELIRDFGRLPQNREQAMRELIQKRRTSLRSH